MKLKALTVIAVFLMLSVPLLAFALPAAAEDGNIDDVRFHVAGPKVVGADKTNLYEISLIDSESRNWKYEAWVTAKNRTGAFPSEAEKIIGNLTGDNKSFQIDITATSNVGTMSIVMNISSPSGALWYTSEEEITVVEPIPVKGTIYNSGQVKINNATVKIYIDEEQIGTDIIESLDPGSSKVVSADWISDDIASGWHEAKFIVDVNGDGIINSDMGDIVFTKDVYVKGAGAASFLILIGILALMIGVLLISRVMKKKK